MHHLPEHPLHERVNGAAQKPLHLCASESAQRLGRHHVIGADSAEAGRDTARAQIHASESKQ